MDVKRKLYEIARYYKVRLYFFKNPKRHPGIGYHKYRVVNGKAQESIMILDGQEDPISTFFHELGHSLCTRLGKYKAYHKLDGGEWVDGDYVYTAKGLRTLIRTGYQAELYVDRLAEREVKKWFPNYAYKPGYIGDPDARKWLYDNYLIYFRRTLDWLNKYEHV